MTVKKRGQPYAVFDRLLMTLLALIFVVGIGFLAQPWLAKELVKFDGNKYMQSSAQIMQENAQKRVTFNADESGGLDAKTLVLNQMNAQKLPVIGLIAIPSVSIHLPIFKGDNYATMCYGAGTAKEDDELGQGNYALASHTIVTAGMEKLLFGPLKNTHVGAMIYLTDKDKVYLYQASSLTQVSRTQGEIIDNHKGKREITLYTCVSYNGPLRWVLRGKFIRSVKFDEKSAQIFNGQDNQWYR